MAEQSMKEESAEEVVSDEEAYLFAMELAGASAVPMVLKSAIELGILETIAKAGPGAHLSPSEIAAQIPNIKNPNAPAMLDRMFRLLVSYNILKLRFPHGNMSERHYALHPKAKYLVNNQDAVSVSAYFLMGHDKVLTEMWYKLTESVEEGGFPFNNAYGMNAFEFHDANPRFNRLFNKGLSDCSSIAMKKILEIYKGFEGVGSLVDVGGGTGAIIGMIASKYSSIKCLNFDLPHVIKEAPSYAGSFHFLPPGNCAGVEHVGGDMFVSVPKADAIFMKWVCHDWNDEQCLKLLKNCYDSLPDTGNVILVEGLISETPNSNLASKCEFQMDIVMLCHSPNGKERTEKEYKALAKGAGFHSFIIICCVFNTYVMEFLKKA